MIVPVLRGLYDCFILINGFHPFKPMKYLLTLALSMFCLASSIAAEEDAAYEALVRIQNIDSEDITPGKCSIQASLDFDSFTNDIAIYRDAWLNRDYSVDYYNQRRKQVFSYLVAKRYAELLTEGLYREKAPKLCNFSVAAKITDKFGQDKKIPILSWQFSQKQNSKINWNKIDPRDFSQLALNYKYSAAIDEWMSDEPEMKGVKATKANNPGAGCDQKMLMANAIFIRATATYCKKNYMDSQAGYFALEMSRRCTSLGEKTVKSIAMEGMHQLDEKAEKGGAAAACEFADTVEANVLHTIADAVANR